MSTIPKSSPNYRKMLTTAEEDQLMRAWQATRDPRLLDQIIREFTPIVRKNAKNLAGYGVDPKELHAEGFLALTEAAWRFDPNMGWKFATYAGRWVFGLMNVFVTKNKFMVNPCTSGNKKKLFYKLRKLVADNDLLHPGTGLTYELATTVGEQFGLPPEEVQYMYSLLGSPHNSLSERVGESNDKNGQVSPTAQDMLICPNGTPEDHTDFEQVSALQHRIVHESVEKVLTPRERRIYEAQILSDQDEITTLQALAGEFGISKERVRQLREMAHEKVTAEIRRRVDYEQREVLFT